MKSKYFYLLSGIVIGAIIVLASVSLVETDATEQLRTGFQEDKQDENKEHKEEFVKLNQSQIKELDVKLSQVGPQKLQMHRDLTGEVVPDPDKVAHIIPRFSGIVKQVHKEIGDWVKKDEMIAVIESNESLVTYEVRSSIDGIVLDLHMTPGELIGDDKHVVTIANLKSLWAELDVYQKDLNEIKPGQQAQVFFDEKANAVPGKIFYLSPTVDEHTRTAIARIRLNNDTGFWKPGMFVTATVFTNLLDVSMAVTINAIQNYEGQKVVFVKEDEGFRPQPVTVGTINTYYAEILSGLNPGQTYVAEGAFIIKSELLKESFGGGHGH